MTTRDMPVAFVAGATGYVGREVVRQLGASGTASVVAHVRPDSSRLSEWQQRFAAMGAAVDTSSWEPKALREALAQHSPQWVFALIGTTKQRANAEGIAAPYQSVDYGLTKLLVDAVVAAGVSSRFVYLSSVGASATSRSAYLQARWQAEQAVRDSGARFTIARPSFITGADRDDDRWGERLMARVTSGALGVAGMLGATTLRDRYRPTTNVALAAALIRLARDPSAEGATLESEALHG